MTLSPWALALSPEQALQRLRGLVQAEGQHEAEVGALVTEMLPVASEAQLLEAWDLLDVFRRRIGAEYGVVVPADAGPGFAVGLELARQSAVPAETVVSVLIREADLLRPAARDFLHLIYEQEIEGFRQHDPRILKWARRSAANGLPSSQRFLGRVLLYGIGVAADPERAVELLEGLPSGEGMLDLAEYQQTLGKDAQARQYLLRAAEEHGLAAGWYNLGVSAKQGGNFVQARDYFSRAQQLDPDFYPALIEHGLMLAAGQGGPRDAERAVALMHRVVDGAAGRERYIAMANLGFFLMRGIGVLPDPVKARRYLEQAARNGVQEAKPLLRQLDQQ